MEEEIRIKIYDFLEHCHKALKEIIDEYYYKEHDGYVEGYVEDKYTSLHWSYVNNLIYLYEFVVRKHFEKKNELNEEHLEDIVHLVFLLISGYASEDENNKNLNVYNIEVNAKNLLAEKEILEWIRDRYRNTRIKIYADMNLLGVNRWLEELMRDS